MVSNWNEYRIYPLPSSIVEYHGVNAPNLGSIPAPRDREEFHPRATESIEWHTSKGERVLYRTLVEGAQ